MSDRKWSGALLESLAVDNPHPDRRGSPRCPYHREQQIAPYFGQDELFPTDFQVAFCIDISTTGVSFFWPRVPTFQAFVIRLGNPDKHVDIVADVRWHSPRPTAAGYIIGGEFVGQLSH